MPASGKGSTSAYITPEGHKKLTDELSYLWKVKRPQVTRAVAEAAAMGDRSENAEYIYGKKQLRQIDARVRFLSKRLNELKVVDRTPEDNSKIYLSIFNTKEENMKRVTGIGGIFFKAKDAPSLQAWYKRHLGIDVQAWGGAAFDWTDAEGKPVAGTTAWCIDVNFVPKLHKFSRKIAHPVS